MGEMKTAVLKNLKNKLSEYLREARAGVRVLVWDRRTAVAELHEPCLDRSLTASLNAPLSDWARSRTVRLPSSEKRKLDVSPVHQPDGTALKLLHQDRGETGS